MDKWLTELVNTQDTTQELDLAFEELPSDELLKLASVTQNPSHVDAFFEKCAEADAMGRVLAQERGDELIKQAFLKFLPTIAKSLGAGKTLAGAVVRKPGIAGAVLGAGAGAATSGRDPRTGKKRWLRGALGGAAVGGLAGSVGAPWIRRSLLNPKGLVGKTRAGGYLRSATKDVGKEVGKARVAVRGSRLDDTRAYASKGTKAYKKYHGKPFKIIT